VDRLIANLKHTIHEITRNLTKQHEPVLIGSVLIRNSLRPPLRSLRLGGECFEATIHRRDAEVAETTQRRTEIRKLPTDH